MAAFGIFAACCCNQKNGGQIRVRDFGRHILFWDQGNSKFHGIQYPAKCAVHWLGIVTLPDEQAWVGFGRVRQRRNMIRFRNRSEATFKV